MASIERKGKKRSKSFYRKCAYGGKKSRIGGNILEPGIKGFLVMCNNDEKSAVRECYNIFNEYADQLYGPDQTNKQPVNVDESKEDSDCDDLEKALKQEVDGLKDTVSKPKRFQNVMANAKNCVFIRTTLEDPVKLVTTVMDDIAKKRINKARYAARILPILETCKAHAEDIQKCVKKVLSPIFSTENPKVFSTYTILYKARNNNGTTCNKTDVISSITKLLNEINPDIKFSWTNYQAAVLVEIVRTVCCVGFAPDYVRYRKYNLQQLQQGEKFDSSKGDSVEVFHKPDNKINDGLKANEHSANDLAGKPNTSPTLCSATDVETISTEICNIEETEPKMQYTKNLEKTQSQDHVVSEEEQIHSVTHNSQSYQDSKIVEIDDMDKNKSLENDVS
ncbi:unnamed protein product [Lymnaea stagnalis]|uniref:THUMP domain-containing protein n=1 Tax=Lymnaea stagnalis TaxID=6523 RepID=A0AAV2H1N5_LYMST